MKTLCSIILILFGFYTLGYAQNDSLLVSTSSTFYTPGLGNTTGQILFASNPSNRTLQVLPARTGDGDLLNGYVFDVAYTNTGDPNGFLFRTGSSNRMIINESGDIGIGTSSPDAKMHISSGSEGIASNYSDLIVEEKDAQIDIISSSEATWGSSINLIEGNGSSNTDIWSIARQTTNGDGNSSLRFNFGSTNTHMNTNKVTFNSNGNVGIGTSSPDATFEVQSNSIPLNSSSAMDANLIIQSESSTRSMDEGATLGFAVPSNTDGSGNWQQGRIIVTPDNTNSSNASGRMFLQTRYYNSSTVAWEWRDNLVLKSDGNVGIGTDSPDQKLTVKGKIHSEEIIVDLNVPGPDYVFEPDYELTTLAELEAFIQANKHLPEIPSAATMEEEGIILGEMNMLLLKKIEELTLHTISQEKVINELLNRIESLENE